MATGWDSDEMDCCWICLEGEKHGDPLVQPCNCPRKVHRVCLAKWQLHSAGKQEENVCRFCNEMLPDWKPALTPKGVEPVSSVMSVRYKGVTYRITYTPGPDGLNNFLTQLRAIGIKVASASQVTFLCRSPDTGDEMALKGLHAFDAAAYCASITAAKRKRLVMPEGSHGVGQERMEESQSTGRGVAIPHGIRTAGDHRAVSPHRSNNPDRITAFLNKARRSLLRWRMAPEASAPVSGL